jgi:cytochrome P450
LTTATIQLPEDASRASLPPGPRAPSAVQLAQVIARSPEYWECCARRYGEPFTLRPLGIGTWVHFWSPDALQHIFTADPEVLEAREGNRMVRPLFGPNSIFLLDGAVHLRRRRVLLPPLHGEPLLAHLDVIAEATRQVIAAWPTGRPFGLRPHMKTITLQVILRTVFGLDEGDQLRGLTADLTELFEVAGSPFLLLMPGMIDRVHFGPWKRFLRLLQRTRRNILSLVAARREATAGGPGRDVLSLLLRATDDEGTFMTDEELRDELMSLLFAGHETTELALTWTLHLLLANPQALLRAREELAAVGGRNGLDLPRVLQLEYLDAIVKESLRLWPVVPAVGRRVKVPTRIGGWTLPAGVNVAPLIYLTHRNPDLYPDPHVFRPERFIGVKPDPHVWLPFGGGQRRCAGMSFAIVEMKIVLASVLTLTRLTLAAGPPVAPRRRGVLRAPTDRARVVLEMRSSAPESSS